MPKGVCALESPECGKEISKAFKRCLFIAYYFQISIWGCVIDRYNNIFITYNWRHVGKFFGDGILEQKPWKNTALVTVLKVWFQDPMGSLRTLQGIYELKLFSQ